MSNELSLKAQERTVTGTAASRRLRREENLVPGIIYGPVKGTQNILLSHDELLHASENEAFYSSIIDIQIGSKKEQAVVKDIQRHPFKPKIIHIDLLRVSADRVITMMVPIHFENEENAPGIKTQGGVLAKHISEVEIRCKAKDLPESLSIDIGELELDQIIHLSALKVPEGVEILALSHDDDNDPPLVAIHIPKVVEEPEEVEESEEGEETAEGEAAESSDEEKSGSTNNDSEEKKSEE